MANKKEILFDGYVQGEEMVEKFNSGNYDIAVEKLFSGTNFLRIRIILKVPGARLNISDAFILFALKNQGFIGSFIQ